MEYVPGPTLAEVRGEFPWDDGRWWRFAAGLLSALETLEHHDLRHRDLKPSNIILRSGEDQPVLVDFGFVVPTNTPAPPAGSLATCRGGVHVQPTAGKRGSLRDGGDPV